MVNRIKEAVEKHRNLILDAQDYIWAHPETGYREWATSKYVEEKFEQLGYELTHAGNVPGFYTTIDTGKPGPCVLILGELDSVICSTHPNANPETGAVHACGHCIQGAALLGVAAALREPEMLEGLSGKIKLCAVPAEELLEHEYRESLREDGIIRYFGGKSEFLSRGYFDDVDLAYMVHAVPCKDFAVAKKWSGCITKKIIYKGAAAHASSAPWNGCNALYAATQGIAAANAVRETFRSEDLVALHSIIVNGGNAVNTIPDKAVVESQIRALSLKSLIEANRRVNRAFCGGALSLGAEIEIQDNFGYPPFENDGRFIDLTEKALQEILPERKLSIWPTDHGCTDIGDLACIMPVVHLFVPGAKGKGHGEDYYVTDPETACVTSAKWMVNILWNLLKSEGEAARVITENYKAPFPSKEEYMEFKDRINRSEDRIFYDGEDGAQVKW